MGSRIGICGVSKFGRKFVALFAAHPDVDEVVLADVRTERLREVAKQHGITRTVSSLDELCQSDVDAIALFTQRWTHAPQVVQALRAGKHVYSAVPVAVTLDELAEVVRTVEATGLIYMLGETGYYHPHSAYGAVGATPMATSVTSSMERAATTTTWRTSTGRSG